MARVYDAGVLITILMALGATLVAILAAVSAVWLVFSTFADAERMQASARWPSVQGIVDASSVETFWSDTAGRTYIPSISYSYEVEGRQFHGADVRIGGLITTSEVAEELVRRHPAGAHVPVFVDPSDPSRAVLQPALPGTFINRPLFAAGAGLVLWTAVFFALVTIASRTTGPRLAWPVIGGLIVAALVCLTGGVRLMAVRSGRGYHPVYSAVCGLGLVAIGAVAIVAPLLALVYRLLVP